MAVAKAFRAMTGISVYEKDNEVKRYEKDDKITDMSENELASEIEVGNVIEWSDTPPPQEPLVEEEEPAVEEQSGQQENSEGTDG